MFFKVKVRIYIGVDFVFEDNYGLPKLKGIAAFVKEYKPLQGIALAVIMETEGLGLGQMNINLRQKIEATHY